MPSPPTSRVYVYRVFWDFGVFPRPTHYNQLEVKKGQHVKVFETTASGWAAAVALDESGSTIGDVGWLPVSYLKLIEMDPVSNVPLMEVRQGRSREEEEQALMDMAILQRRKFQQQVRKLFGRTREEEEQARMDMAIIQRRKLKLNETIVWF